MVLSCLFYSYVTKELPKGEWFHLGVDNSVINYWQLRLWNCFKTTKKHNNNNKSLLPDYINENNNADLRLYANPYLLISGNWTDHTGIVSDIIPDDQRLVNVFCREPYSKYLKLF